ncbi:MAG: N-6 DNA methylase, partial [Chloroflexi bacterium]|nr:N-6 DNA methylase [Chloroflexota bacterium]
RDKPDSETEVRIQFVDPLFSALGWDMRDKRQVRHEPSVTVQEAGLERSKYADYSFHIGNTRHFFVETKMPHINLERNTVPAFQLRRYGWSGGTPVSVLTDFEEFCVYDCRLEPNQKDPADKARLRYWTFQNYIDDWDEIEARFSREAVAQGALREWVEGKRVRGILSVDQSFLGKMEEWRELLAKDIALHNRDLSQRQLNLLVQRTIDRIVFLRIAEDRDIESYRRLRSAASEGKQVYEELKRLFVEADDKYNSGLFHFSDEKRASEPDRDSLKIHIPDEPLRQIIKNLYFPFSPFEFTVMPPEILGQVYEQFLGKVIELSPGGAVRVEEKPEVRKAGGVYYTPTYIVDYIVENTVGALLEGKTPADAAKLRILDPACGSGSFLVGAYQYLLDWHLESYSREPDKHKNVLRRIVGGYVLTTAEKRRILQNNIYGVDLDQNAVEVS